MKVDESPKLTPSEVVELKRLICIMRDPSRLPGERRIAMVKFDVVYNSAISRTQREVNECD